MKIVGLTRTLVTAAGISLLSMASMPAAALDAEAAEKLMRKSGCLKCHTPDKKKDGPTFREITAKVAKEKIPESKLIDRIMKGAKVKIDGKEEDHEIIKTKDVGEASNVIQWILSHK